MKSHVREKLLIATALGTIVATPAWAQQTAEKDINEIIVSAQRVEQRLQDVPISITVVSQETITNNNIVNAKDLASFTPGLTVNNRYGSDNTTFAIRGFIQDQRTYATVGTFFADVVALRGSGATFGGDGAGPGNLFDLQNVQVLKGPQGTLFGRNVTGGAVLLVPQKPTDKFGGYVEASAGDYNMWRGQGVVNVPVSDKFRVRAGIDRMKRDGYLKNVGIVGDGRFGNHGMGDTNYTAGRLSAVADLSENIENYTIFSMSESHNNGVIPKVLACNPGVAQAIDANPADSIQFGNMACAQIAREQSAGFWSVSNRVPDSQSVIKQWQLINTTTWAATDTLTAKNIFSYGELRGTTDIDLFGTYFLPAGVTPGTENAGQVTGFAFTHAEPRSNHTNAQSSLVEEIQLQGHPSGGKLTWQAGFYFEDNEPLGYSGVDTATFTACADVASLNCAGRTPGLSLGSGVISLSSFAFTDYAGYAQASYELTSKLKLTGGFRYTWDKVDGTLINENLSYTARTLSCANATAADFGKTFTFSQRYDVCNQPLTKTSKAPTWLIDLDYKLENNVLLYAKWSRGYRQGGIAFFGPDPIQPFNAERVDTYEGGMKSSWRGSMPGYFDISGFYNDFKNQQLLLGVYCDPTFPNYKGPCSTNAAIVNAANSHLYGIETEVGITAFDRLHLSAGYSYLHTKIVQFTSPSFPTTSTYNAAVTPLVDPLYCSQTPFCNAIPGTVPHKLTLAANVDVPVPDSVGKLNVGATLNYTSRYRVVADARPDLANGRGNGVLPGSRVLNLNANLSGVAGRPVDLSLFVTNLTNEHIYLQVNDSLVSRGFNSYTIGEPRMFGARLKYRFGG